MTAIPAFGLNRFAQFIAICRRFILAYKKRTTLL
jgi:hypothetical protein